MKKTKSTFERVMADPKQKKAFEKEYANFLLSELLLDAMTRQEISVRALSRASGISTSVIQNLRAMQPVNITLKTLNALLSTLGYELVARKGRHCVNLSTPTSASSTRAGA
ncbi:MAG: helix-turn-helix transcriptional regulator [Fibrobacter sp.]|jgi:DNA-binding Xre family transcriptional regulator|nr:helix-turn-helix transcriptional regulator [Fibrobacter sp.]